MAEKTIEVLVEGGKATAAPPLGPALGPMGVNIGEVVSEINKKTASFKGMQVPVKVIVDEKTKEFNISIGTPPTSELIKKEAGIPKGAANPIEENVANLTLDQVKKVADMKGDDLLGNGMKSKAKEVAGTCRSMGVYVEGMLADEFIKQVNEGKFDNQLS